MSGTSNARRYHEARCFQGIFRVRFMICFTSNFNTFCFAIIIIDTEFVQMFDRIDLFYGYELDDLSLVSKAVRQALKGMSCLFPGDHPYYDAVVAPRVIDDFSLRVVEYWCRPSDLKRNPFQKWLHTLKRIRIMHDCRAMSFDDIVTTLGSVSHLEFVELWLFGEFDSNYVLDVSMLPKSLKQLDLWLNQIPLQGMKYPDNLQSLKLVQCDKLEVLDIPATLRNLTITGFCGGLDPFSNNLTHFKLQGCEISGVLCLPPNTREIIIERTEVGTLVFDGCTPSLIVFIDNDIGQIKAANGASIPEYLTLWPEYSEHQFAFGSARHDRRFRDEQYWCHTFGPVSHEYKEYDYMSIFSEKNPREAITLADILSFEFAKESSNVLYVFSFSVILSKINNLLFFLGLLILILSIAGLM